MQNNFELPILITPRTFRGCKIWSISVHSGAAVFMLLSSLPLFCKLTLLLPLICSYLVITGKYCRKSCPDSVIRVYFNEDDEWWLTTAAGDTIEVQLVTPYFVHARLIVLVFKTDSSRKRYRVILTAAAADADSLRRLRVRLRFPRQAGMTAPVGE